MVREGHERPPSLVIFIRLAKGLFDAPRTYLGQDPNDPVIKKLHANRPALPAPGGAVIRTPAEFAAHARKLLRCGTQVENGSSPGVKRAFVSNPDRRKEIAAELAKHGAKGSV